MAARIDPEDIELGIIDGGSDAARWAMTQYFDELARRFPSGFEAPGALDDAAHTYNPPNGLFLLATRDGEIVGCGAVQFLDAKTGEVKRMWVSPVARGRGLGRRLLARLEEEIESGGRTQIVLDTNGALIEAIALYVGRGYVEIPAYNDNPYAQHWFEKRVGPPA